MYGSAARNMCKHASSRRSVLQNQGAEVKLVSHCREQRSESQTAKMEQHVKACRSNWFLASIPAWNSSSLAVDVYSRRAEPGRQRGSQEAEGQEG